MYAIRSYYDLGSHASLFRTERGQAELPHEVIIKTVLLGQQTFIGGAFFEIFIAVATVGTGQAVPLQIGLPVDVTHTFGFAFDLLLGSRLKTIGGLLFGYGRLFTLFLGIQSFLSYNFV